MRTSWLEQVCLGRMGKVRVDFQGLREEKCFGGRLDDSAVHHHPLFGIVGEGGSGLPSRFLTWETGR